MGIKVNLYELISKRLAKIDRPFTWLAKQAGCDESNLRKTLKGERYVYVDLLYRLSEALGEDLFIYYSQNLKKTGQIHRQNRSNSLAKSVILTEKIGQIHR